MDGREGSLMAFNLADMVNNRKKSTETENISDTVYRDVFELEPSKDNFYSTDPEKLQGLKNSILLFGVMQDVLIEDVDGKDRIISGHCRTMCCRMLVEEGHEEFRKINCKYTKVNLNTEKFPEDKDGKVEQLINKLGIIQANRFREKSDWEKMQEALITEEVIKELRDLVDLQGTTRSMVQATLGTSGTQLERYHAIQKKLSQEFMQEFRNGNINISVARELTDLDEKHQDEALGLYKKNETITLPEVKALKEKQEVGRQIPGQLTLDEVIGRRRPPEDGTVIDVDIQIERFFESLKKSTTERIQKRDKNMSIYMLSIIYNDVRIRNGYLNYQGKSNGILFNPGSGDEKLITWQQLAETLIEKYGKKQKAVKLAPMPEPQKECPYYDANEVFLPDIARMINVFLENAYKGMGPGNTRRFRVMGTEFAAVQRQKEDDFVFYDEQGEKVCYVSRERMAAEYQKRMEPEEPVIEESDMSDSDKCERCENAAENKKTEDEKQQIIELIPEAWPPELKDIPVPSMIVMDDILQDAEENLKNYLSVADQGIPGRTILKYQLIAGGLRMIKNLVRDCLDDENIDDGKSVMEQLPLPVMRNNDQRKEWLRNYKDWGLWYTDEHIGVRYYKYDFANGARLIAEEYDRDTVHSQWVSDHTESYYMHLIGGPEPERKSGIPKWTQHGRYNKFPNSESELVEFLKEVQRESNCTGQK
ncbi:ParB N-terminal domain-containing protein [Blautia faecis]|uniref:ParB/RepB/Spo0J family partition protein n=1 Tax=Blautia faecis TaxID=871665 RepID=UPI00156D5307|nr:ParB/RepB/Spo0J family partition protein [Blautia faecis]NSG90160.1 ParB N-terminal domain-containing protein [Blautia faecis]